MPPSGRPPSAIPPSGMPPSGLDARLRSSRVIPGRPVTTDVPSTWASVTFCGGVPANAGSSARRVSHLSGRTSGIVESGTPPSPFWLRFFGREPDAAERDAAERDPAERDAAERDAAERDAAERSGEVDPVSPRIASSGMSAIGAETAPGSELSGPVIEIAADGRRPGRPPVREGVPGAEGRHPDLASPVRKRRQGVEVLAAWVANERDPGPVRRPAGSASKIVAFVRFAAPEPSDALIVHIDPQQLLARLL